MNRTKSGQREKTQASVFILIFIWVPLGVNIHLQSVCMCVSVSLTCTRMYQNASIFCCFFAFVCRDRSSCNRLLDIVCFVYNGKYLCEKMLSSNFEGTVTHIRYCYIDQRTYTTLRYTRNDQKRITMS